MADHDIKSSIVVGVDGSRPAVHAAVWAVDEAVARDVPLRVVHVVEEHLDDTGNAVTAGQAALADAVTAITATGKPVKVETEILRGHALSSLAKASQSAAMVCVGPVGRHRIASHRVGSTATALASSAHCPVAIIRAGEPSAGGRIVVDLGEAAEESAVLHTGMEEARLRGVPVDVVATWHTQVGDTHDERTIEEGNQRVRAQLERRLAPWTRRYSDVELSAVAVHGSFLDYLTHNAGGIQLVVVGTGAPGDELLGPTGSAVLRKTDRSVLLVAHHHL